MVEETQPKTINVLRRQGCEERKAESMTQKNSNMMEKDTMPINTVDFEDCCGSINFMEQSFNIP